MKLKIVRINLLFLSFLFNIFVNLKILRNDYSHLCLFLWLLSLVCLVLSAVSEKTKFKPKRLQFSPRKIFIMLIIFLPSIARIANYNLTRIHGDDILTAYFSAHYDFKQNFFSAVPSDKGQWVSQFPTPFFVLQKIFFLVFGESLLSIKLSIIPYVFVVSLFLFLIVKKVLDEKTAIVSLVLYSFFPISLYLETLGLHFISSTAIFMVFFYFLILALKNNTTLSSTLAGLLTGFCYLTYSSSYLALPVLIIFFMIQSLQERKVAVIKNLLLAIIAFGLTLGPFLIYAHKFDNYFIQRINQVSLLTGQWSGAREKVEKGESIITIIKKNLSLSIRSFYTHGIGGHGGYNFGRLAFFEKTSLGLFIIGSSIGCILLFF